MVRREMGKKRKSNPSVSIIAIIDKSGSMAPLTDSTISGFNEFIEEQKKIDGECKVSVVLFSGNGDSDGIRTLYEQMDVQLIAPLTRRTYIAGGNTPLYDAIGRTLIGSGGITADKKIVLVITDGYENSSRVYTRDSVRSMIQSLKSRDWEFVFMGANVEKDYAYSIGFDSGSTFTYNPTDLGTRSVYYQVTNSMSSLRSGASESVSGSINQEALQTP